MTQKKYQRLFKTRNFGLLIGLCFSVFFCLVGFSSGFFNTLESKLLDQFFSIKDIGTRSAVQKGVWQSGVNPALSPDILIVGVDLKALEKFGSWPFPRGTHADLINSFSRIKNQNDREKSVFLDFFFIDETGNPAEDFRLANSMSESGRIFLESILETSSVGQTIDDEMFARQELLFAQSGRITDVRGDWKSIEASYGLQTNQPLFNSAVKGYGLANIVPDENDSTVRKQSLVLKYSKIRNELAIEELAPGFTLDEAAFERLCWFDSKGNEHQITLPLTEKSVAELRKAVYKNAPPLLYDGDGDGTPESETRAIEVVQDYFLPSIAFALAVDYWGAKFDDCTVIPGESITVRRPENAPVVIPVDSQCRMFINYAGRASSAAADGYKTFPVRSYAGYARKTGEDTASWPDTRAVGGKIVMVGAFDKGMADDEKQTPFGMMFGIEIHANTLNTLLTGSFIHRFPLWLNMLITFCSIMLVAFIASRMKSLWSLPLCLLISLVMMLACSFAFDSLHLLFNYSVPFMGMFFSYVTVTLYRASTEEREKRKIRTMFGKYVSPEVVAQMMDNPPELGGVDRELTVFFSDIRGFTSLSETLSPQELVKHLNIYLTAMTDIILETGGTLDKYVGDEIMCFWGAPLEVKNHAARACLCALRQKEKLTELNGSWPSEKRLAIGIGINTGIMTVGNMGSEGRMNYTLMGDNVNLGARLEGTNKIYGTMIIVSEYTYAMVKDRFVFRELDTIRVKGKNRPVVIYELVDEIR
jgi:Adenylate cyclase, family 3 (some proteins contain HAMP domain)